TEFHRRASFRSKLSCRCCRYCQCSRVRIEPISTRLSRHLRGVVPSVPGLDRTSRSSAEGHGHCRCGGPRRDGSGRTGINTGAGSPATPPANGSKPNILVIFGDDIGLTNVSAYSMGLMGYRTPNIDRIAKEGMMFTDYYAEQSCTAGRSTFITGQ